MITRTETAPRAQDFGYPGKRAGPFATEARVLAELDAALAGSDPCAKLQAASRLLHHGLTAEAIEGFQSIAERHPERRFSCLERIGDVLSALGCHGGAADSYCQALAAGAPEVDRPRLQGKAARALRSHETQ